MAEAAAILGPLASPAEQIGRLLAAPLESAHRRRARAAARAAHDASRAQARARLSGRNAGRLRAAVDAGADAVYCGFDDETNARNFPGLNFSRDRAGRRHRLCASPRRQGFRRHQHLRARGRARRSGTRRSTTSRRLGADAAIVADSALLDYAATASSRAAAASVGAGGRGQSRRDQFLCRALRGQARGAAARAHGRRDRRHQSRDRLRDRGVRVRRPVRDGGGALLAVVLCDRPLAQHERRVLAAEPRRLWRGERRSWCRGSASSPSIACRAASRCPTRRCARAASRRQAWPGTSSRIRRASMPARSFPQLAEAGVTALKIEGRQRSRSYTEAVVRGIPRGARRAGARRAGRPLLRSPR